MKKLINTIFYVVTSMILVIAFVMSIIEIRLLISGDFLLCENVIVGFVKYLLRLIISLCFVFVMISELFKSIQQIHFINNNLYFIEWLLFVSSIVVLLYGTNYIGLVTFIFSSLFILFKTLKRQINNKN